MLRKDGGVGGWFTDGYNLLTLTKVGVELTGIDLTTKMILMRKIFLHSSSLQNGSVSFVRSFFFLYFAFNSAGCRKILLVVCLFRIFTGAMCLATDLFSLKFVKTEIKSLIRLPPTWPYIKCNLIIIDPHRDEREKGDKTVLTAFSVIRWKAWTVIFTNVLMFYVINKSR